jgi:hypothetical protein
VQLSDGVWLQNIDSKDLVRKISGMRILRERQKQAPTGMTTRRATAKATAEATAKQKAAR